MVEKRENKIREKRVWIIICILIVALITAIVLMFREKKSYRLAIENNYNMAFFQLIDNIQDVEAYLAKSIISNSPESGTENLTYVWKEANLAQTYLSMLPINSEAIENTAKFLNQVSDYSYSLTKKTISNQSLSQEELDNLEKLHDYTYELKDMLNQLSADFNSGRISWLELSKEKKPAFSQEVVNNTQNGFDLVEQNFHEYAGLIYDGAFSEHMTNPEHRGLTGDYIDEQNAQNIAVETIGAEKTKNIIQNGSTENATIESYDFTIESNDNNLWWISISKKGGHVISINSNRIVYNEAIDEENAGNFAEKYLIEKGYPNMKKTYYSKNNGIETINFAYEQNGVTVYPDLIKVKVALDNGEILGFESTGYLNSHTERNIPEVKVTKEEAVAKINPSIDVLSIGLAIIPTKFQTELTCWEIKGKAKERDFLVYVNVESGKEEDILMILNSSEGTLTM